MSDGNLLMTIPRSATERIHISTNEFKGKKYLDLRTYYTTDDGMNWSPTKKGITVPPEKLIELKSAIEKAMEEFEIIEE